VPLHGEHVMTGQFEASTTRRGGGRRYEVVAQHGQGLVVQRVHANCLRVQRGEQGPGTTFTRACARDRPCPLGMTGTLVEFDVLVQRAP